MLKNQIIVRGKTLVVLAKHRGLTYEILFDKDMLPTFRSMTRSIYLSWENNGTEKRLVARYEYPTPKGQTRHIVHMARVAVDAKTDEYAIHINGDTLDNRKSNIVKYKN